MDDQPDRPRQTLLLPGSARGRPLRVAVLGSNGPHHRYLFSILAQRFDLVGVIMERPRGQSRRLLRRRRYRDWFYRRVHEARQRVCGYRRYRRRYFHRLGPHVPPPPGVVRHVDSVNDHEVPSLLDEWAPDITVICGTSIVGSAVLGRAGTAINIHAGHLPEYRGNQGIFMALYRGDQARVGGSLHLATAELDAGPLLAVIRSPVQPGDTEEAIWCRAMHGAMAELVELLARMASGEPVPVRDQPPGGRPIRNRDRGLGTDLVWFWRWLTRRRRLVPQPEWITYGDGTRVEHTGAAAAP